MSTVLVLGLGESGLAMARWSARHGAAVRVWDSRAEPPQAVGLAAHVPMATRLAQGALGASELTGIDRILKSPGLAPHDPGIAALLAAASKAGVPVLGELDVFAEALEALRTEFDYAPKLIAVTGTNGKTTTTAMTALLVEGGGKRVAVAGNIGPTMLQTLADAIDAGPNETLRERLPEVWVLELSSFQLADSTRFDADAAAILNLTEDHLDWHGSMTAYAGAKARVFGKRAVVVVNRDDAAAMRLVPPPETLAPTRKGRASRIVPRRVVTFGARSPERPGDWGLVVDNDMGWLVRARDDDASPRDLTLQQLMPADALRIRGRHNALNALAALALATAIGCPLAPMLHALREYKGEPHRVELVASIDGIDAFDDSKGTNVGATVAALDGLGADRAPGKLVVILGGDGKGQDFSPLAAPLARHARAVLTIGRDAARIERVLADAGIAFERCATLESAVDGAFAKAERGDAVLLSPACASLDMFRNYAHRAEVFVAAVRAVALHRGVVA
ncbi:MAG: UDP-N-acetylmuramoyl-L-alanine--D-glutamate ligase [Caldimonas sp.]